MIIIIICYKKAAYTTILKLNILSRVFDNQSIIMFSKCKTTLVQKYTERSSSIKFIVLLAHHLNIADKKWANSKLHLASSETVDSLFSWLEYLQTPTKSLMNSKLSFVMSAQICRIRDVSFGINASMRDL